MGNCLKTQLKESVQNSNLIGIGEMTFKMSGRQYIVDFNCNPTAAGKSVKVSCIDGTNCLSFNSDGSNPTNSIIKTTNIYSYLLPNTPLKKFKVENKYDITRLSIFGGIIEDFNINELDYNTELESVFIKSDANSPLVTGDVNKMIAGKTPFAIGIQNMPNVTINVNELGSRCQRLTNISVIGCQIHGTVQGYVNAARQVLSSGELDSSGSEWHLDDDTVVYTKSQGKIIWTSDTITIQAISGDIVINA